MRVCRSIDALGIHIQDLDTCQTQRSTFDRVWELGKSVRYYDFLQVINISYLSSKNILFHFYQRKEDTNSYKLKYTASEFDKV